MTSCTKSALNLCALFFDKNEKLFEMCILIFSQAANGTKISFAVWHFFIRLRNKIIIFSREKARKAQVYSANPAIMEQPGKNNTQPGSIVRTMTQCRDQLLFIEHAFDFV